MPNESLTPDAGSTVQADALAFLKGKDNPFDVFVTARRPDAEFARWHVPTLHREVLDPLIAVMERYRPEQLQTEADLPRAGMVVILGARGNGKTHTLLALKERLDSGPLRLLIAPVFFEPQRPFAEYLLHQMLRHLEEDPGRTLHHLADALTRQILVQALFGMTDVDWLARHTRGRAAFWRHLFGWGTGKLAHGKRRLIDDLKQQRTVSLSDLCRQNDLRPGMLHRLALQHLQRSETGTTISELVRRGLYEQLINLAFSPDGNAEQLIEFLFDGYTRIGAKNQPSRTELVDSMIETLLQLFLLARLPVLFAFDALEALLGDPPQQEMCVPFFQGVANFCDAHRGVAFLFFAETGHWQQAEKYMSHFAQQRFEQGVIRVPQFGTVSRLTLAPMTVEKLAAVIEARVRPVLTDFTGPVKELPRAFPFTEEDVRTVVGKSVGLPLRLAMQALGARYERLVYGTAPAMIAPAPARPPAPEAAMEERWQEAVREAKSYEGSWSTAILVIHAGIKFWLDSLIATGTAISLGRLIRAESQTSGNHPFAGQITRLDVQGEQGAVQVVLGLLLSQGKGMPGDLKTKLSLVASENGKLARFVLLWPRGADLVRPIHDQLPPATRDIWTAFAKDGLTSRVVLKSIDKETLYPWLALPRWINKVKTEVEGATEPVMHKFIVEHTRNLLPLLEGEK
jgi:hypothetical protein